LYVPLGAFNDTGYVMDEPGSIARMFRVIFVTATPLWSYTVAVIDGCRSVFPALRIGRPTDVYVPFTLYDAFPLDTRELFSGPETFTITGIAIWPTVFKTPLLDGTTGCRTTPPICNPAVASLGIETVKGMSVLETALRETTEGSGDIHVPTATGVVVGNAIPPYCIVVASVGLSVACPYEPPALNTCKLFETTSPAEPLMTK